MTVREKYEISLGVERHMTVNVARMENATPTATQPGALISVLAGTQLTGTILNVENSIAILDVTPGMIYAHKVRNVRTYAAAAEDTFGTILEGDPIYYDGSATMPADCFLSTSPLDAAGAANPLFGHAVFVEGLETAVATNPPTTVATASTETLPVIQVGAGR